MARTPAIAAAERAGVPFRTHEYAHDRRAESYGLEAAEKLGRAPGRVFKTLVVEVDGKLGVAVVPVAAQLDLKALGGKRSGLVGREAASGRPATCSAGSPLWGSASACRWCSTPRRSHTRRSASAPAGAGPSSSSIRVT